MFFVIVAVVVFTTCVNADTEVERLEVRCPPFDKDSSSHKTILTYTKSSNDEFCTCTLSEHGTAKTAILKCEFNDEQDIVLKGSLFPFRELNVTSAYVRMRNARSAYITKDFLSAWMDAPSSALDLWHCGRVTIDSTPKPHELQLFSELKSFVGVGIISCNIKTLPSFFLRDRSRAAFRVKDCSVEKIEMSLFHNVEEVRYMNFEDSTIGEVTGPLSSSGVLTLSKKEIHTWDGVEIINSTFNYIASNSFNVTHRDVDEKFILQRSVFGKLEEDALTISGDINVVITENNFTSLDPFAIQVSVNGKIAFTSNVIDDYYPDSLYGLRCENTSVIGQNTFSIYSADQAQDSHFKEECGHPESNHVFKERKAAMKSSETTPIVMVVIIVTLLIIVSLTVIWGWKNWSLLRCSYRRSDTPLWKEQSTSYAEDDSTPRDDDSHPTSVQEQPLED